MYDWRWKLSIMLFLAIPFGGVLIYARHYEMATEEKKLPLCELADSVTSDLTQVCLTDFEPVSVSKYSAVLAIPDTPEGNERYIRLALRKQDATQTLEEIVASGEVRGLTSSQHWYGAKSLRNYGIEPLDESGVIRYVQVNREYMTSIAVTTAVFSLLGLIPLFWVYNRLEESRFKDSQVRTQTKSQVALQLMSARYDNYKIGM